MEKIPDSKIDILLNRWLMEIVGSKTDTISDYVGIKEIGHDENGNEKIKLNIYTDKYTYRITAIDREKDEGYLGCGSICRKSRAGEDWFRGNDLPDGKFTKKTWEKIKNSILLNELVKVERPKEYIVDWEFGAQVIT